jgi:hypothetical protein
MAERLNKNHSESCLKRIRTSQLLNRVQDHALGQVEMSKTELTAACFLIERTLAKAEAPKELKVSGELTLVEILRQASQPESPDGG